MKAACDFGSTIGTVVECVGFPGLGGGLAGDCENYLRNSQGGQAQPCPSNVSTTVQACQNGRPVDPDTISKSCAGAANNLKNQGRINQWQVGTCAKNCKEQTSALAASSCAPKKICKENAYIGTQPCSTSNGSGLQTITCNSSGTGREIGQCKATSCSSGYSLQNGQCTKSSVNTTCKAPDKLWNGNCCRLYREWCDSFGRCDSGS